MNLPDFPLRHQINGGVVKKFHFLLKISEFARNRLFQFLACFRRVKSLSSERNLNIFRQRQDFVGLKTN
ncbi:MAG TPA: hypothetical protein DHV62_03195 [Elusimicrobia bacterium]|nr:hypothetical protein [Elusimicrobiota bacterium]